MLAAKDQHIDEASKTIFRLSADEQIRKRCLDREEYYLDKMAMERTIEEYHLDKMAMERTIESQKAELADKDVEIQRLRAEIEKIKNSGLQTN